MLSGFIPRIRSLWEGVHRTEAVDAEMNEEFRLHMELRAADLVRAGLTADEAERRARVEFGGTYNYKEAGRASRGLRWFDALRFSWLDFKLGARMLLKYPGLTLVSSAAMGVAIAIGAGVMTVVALLTDPKLPLEEGERIIGIQVWDISTRGAERRILADMASWREELRSVQDIGGFRETRRNLITSEGRAESMRAAEMSASGFRVAGVAPLMGRYLVDEDERPGAPAVVVLGYDIWRSRFGADSGVVGRPIRFGVVPHTVVGVMPNGFAFPVADGLWVPLRANPLEYKRREGPGLFVFGRLAPDATLEAAQAEIEAHSARVSEAFPETHRTLRARLMPYAQSWFELDDPGIVLMYRTVLLIVVLLLVVICVNIAILVYARTATRQSEIAVRSALGASRSRIVAQLFGEALVLSVVGGLLGFGIIWEVASQVRPLMAQMGVVSVPFWLTAEVSGSTLGYVAALAVLSAVIIGVIPGLQVTGRRVQASLQRLAGGHASVRLGRTWTALIIAEVALTVALLPPAVWFSALSVKAMMVGPGFAAEQFLSASLSMDRELPAPGVEVTEYWREFQARFTRNRDELLRRLNAHEDVIAATFADEAPGSEPARWMELDSASAPVSVRMDSEGPLAYNAYRARFGQVSIDFFATFDVPVVAGRAFGPADADSAARALIVNRTFVDSVFRGRNVLGERIRTFRLVENERRPGPWYHIVGVVNDFPAAVDIDRPLAAVYRAADNSEFPVSLAIRTRHPDAGTFSGTLRALTVAADPMLQLRNVQPLDEVLQTQHLPLKLISLALVIVTLSVLVLASAGVYALMSVIVTQRRREIGIRIALGADARHVLSSIFSRAALQLGAGTAVGITAAVLFDKYLAEGWMMRSKGAMIFPAVCLFIAGVGVLAALGPARRGLRIQPTEALKEE